MSDVSPSATATSTARSTVDERRATGGNDDPAPPTAEDESAHESAEHAQASPTVVEQVGADDGHDDDAAPRAEAPAPKRARFAQRLVDETRDVVKDAEAGAEDTPRVDDPTPGLRRGAAPTAGDDAQASSQADHG